MLPEPGMARPAVPAGYVDRPEFNSVDSAGLVAGNTFTNWKGI